MSRSGSFSDDDRETDRQTDRQTKLSALPLAHAHGVMIIRYKAPFTLHT